MGSPGVLLLRKTQEITGFSPYRRKITYQEASTNKNSNYAQQRWRVKNAKEQNSYPRETYPQTLGLVRKQ